MSPNSGPENKSALRLKLNPEMKYNKARQ